MRIAAYLLLLCVGCAQALPPAGEEPEVEPESAPPLVEALPVGEEPESQEAVELSIDELCVLPPSLPPTLGEACEAVSVSTDAFMQRVFEGEARERWNAAKQVQLRMTQANCMKVASISVAACQIHALDRATATHRRKLPEIMKVCRERFA